MKRPRDLVIVTGSSGYIGRAVIEKLAPDFTLAGFDRETPQHPPAAAECICIDLTCLASHKLTRLPRSAVHLPPPLPFLTRNHGK